MGCNYAGMSAKQQAKKIEIVPITVRLPTNLVRELKVYAASESTPIQEVVERAVSMFLRKKG